MEEAPTPAASSAPDAPKVQVVQLVRNIGAETTADVRSVDSVNAELAELYAKGFKLTAVRPVAAVPGGLMIYYMFTKGM